MISNYIFDWSGTLSDDFEMVYKATAKVLYEAYNGYNLTESEYRENFELPYMKFYRKYDFNSHKDEVDRLFMKHVAANNIFPTPLPRAGEILKKLRAKGKKTYLFSAHPKSLVAKEIESYGFANFFDGIESGVSDKVATLKNFVKNHKLNPTETAYVGDLVHDVKAAKEAGLKSVGIQSRYQTTEKLASANPDYMIKDIGELLEL
ncbi:HAD hydrolase-like protein [Candidatus Micrarchaeota archaeon]|nr:HAD hydrolase-like protein [Candidatus Micrarchaeota archaeon]